jgi:ADP-ribosylglycohydrolase
MCTLSYETYLDKVRGGWLGKCIGGAIGDRFEGTKSWIEIAPAEMFPPQVPPNDDLDLQVLWLKVLEEHGPRITADDLAEAWRDWCWYPYNEYAVFRRNIRQSIAPPASGRFGNQFWDTGMGCAIRAEVFAYVSPGNPDRAIALADIDGQLDHTEEAVSAERMLAGMMADAFFEPDIRKLLDRYVGQLMPGSATANNVRTAITAWEAGMPLRDALERVKLTGGVTEACDARINMPIIVLGLLYGEGDFEKSLHATLSCGFDADSTMATVGSVLGQIIGAGALPRTFVDLVGDELVVDIRYRRPEMTLSALARDTARLGVLLSPGGTIEGAPEFAPPEWASAECRPVVRYLGPPSAAPGETIAVEIAPTRPGSTIAIDCPAGWTCSNAGTVWTLRAPKAVGRWADTHLFRAVETSANGTSGRGFGIAGAAIWRLLGIFQEPEPPRPADLIHPMRRFNLGYVDPARTYLPEPPVDTEVLHAEMSRLLGRPAVIHSREGEIDITPVIGMGGSLVAYLERTVICEAEREAFVSIGHTDPFRLFLNDELIAGATEHRAWAPFNVNAALTLRPGANRFVLKLVRESDTTRLTFAIRERGISNGERRNPNSPNHQDLMLGLSDLVQPSDFT